jgi:hypothetical protein
MPVRMLAEERRHVHPIGHRPGRLTELAEAIQAQLAHATEILRLHAGPGDDVEHQGQGGPEKAGQ